MRHRAYIWLGMLGLGLSGCARKPELPVTLSFPDFPQNVAVLDLGQAVTIDVVAANDSGAGVTWSCAGPGCGPLKTTPTSVIFKAGGITGRAVLTATSRKQPEVTKKFRISVGLNESPDMLCK